MLHNLLSLQPKYTFLLESRCKLYSFWPQGGSRAFTFSLSMSAFLTPFKCHENKRKFSDQMQRPKMPCRFDDWTCAEILSTGSLNRPDKHTRQDVQQCTITKCRVTSNSCRGRGSPLGQFTPAGLPPLAERQQLYSSVTVRTTDWQRRPFRLTDTSHSFAVVARTFQGRAKKKKLFPEKNNVNKVPNCLCGYFLLV